MRALVLALAACAVVAGCGADPTTGAGPPTTAADSATATGPTTATAVPPPGDHEQTVTVDGRQRSFVVHVPTGLPASGRLPVVIVLHGGGGNARNAAEQTGMSEQADRGGFLAVYPNGSGLLDRSLLTWNSGTCCGYALDNGVDDVAFVSALLDELERGYGVDSRRIFVTGMSNGAMMSYRLACELADRIAAIAPVAGSMGVDCRPSAPVSIVAFHGTADRHVRYQGGAPEVRADPHARQDPPVADTISFWAGHDRCGEATTERVSADTTRRSHSCPDGVGVTLYTIDGGGHAWPGGRRAGTGADRPTGTVSATELMWEFFQQHPRPAK